MNAPRKRGRPPGTRDYPSSDFEKHYKQLEATGEEPSPIRADLVARFGDNTTPPLRTIQRWVREDRSLDKSGPWRLSMSSPEEWPAIYESLSVAMDQSDGATKWLTALEAGWIARIYRMSEITGTTIDPFMRYLLARQLARAEAKRDSDYTVDAFFGMVTGLLPELALDDGWVHGVSGAS